MEFAETMTIFAHSKPEAEESDWQPLLEHLVNVAELAGRFGNVFAAGDWAATAGLWHDIGKASEEYQRRLRPGGGKGRVDHSTAGAQLAEKELGGRGRLLAACVAGHHSGLLDGVSVDDSCLARRLKKIVPTVSFPGNPPKPEKLPTALPFRPERQRQAFQLSFLVRMLFSCLVDADFLDTERFMDPQKGKWRHRFPPLGELWHRFSKNLAAKLSNVPISEINLRRKKVIDACLAKAQDPPGFFSLTVPTGGGKTISSLAFALKHALRHGLDRIIYVIPFTSIIEQNAEVFRELLGEDAVLEHHSAFDSTRWAGQGSEEDELLRKVELAAENWDAPVVVTTGVQFFESLFACRTSRCRKLHNIARSVIVLDEAQMIPVPFLLPCMEAIRELALNYGCSVVLCTATQPALNRNEEVRQGLEGVREIIADPSELYRAFRRVTVEDVGELSLEHLVRYLRNDDQVLCVVNTRREAREVFQLVWDEDGAFHLSAQMCPEHRSVKLAQIRERLKEGQACRVVSTQLIEAGVDIDFPVVLRAVAGIDSIAQAAGRCNREGKLPRPGRVVIFRLDETFLPLEFRAPVETAAEVVRSHEDPLSIEAVEDFFRLLYWRAGKKLDSEGILEDAAERVSELHFPFRTIAEKFRFIRDAGEPVLIPYDEKGRSIIRQLRFAEFPGRLLREGQRYAVQIPWWALQKLEAAGAVERIRKVFPALTAHGFDSCYHDQLGLVFKEQESPEPESLIV